jgi:hypothetical protein
MLPERAIFSDKCRLGHRICVFPASQILNIKIGGPQMDYEEEEPKHIGIGQQMPLGKTVIKNKIVEDKKG